MPKATLAERRLSALYTSIASELRKYTRRVLADYPKLVDKTRVDTVGVSRVVGTYFKTLEVAWAAYYKQNARSFEQSLTDIGVLADFDNLKEFKAGINGALNRMGTVTPKARAFAISAEPNIPKAVSRRWTKQQLSLIKDKGTALVPSIPEKHFERLLEMVDDATHTGLRVEELRKQLEELDGVNMRRAEVIARDQIGKYNGKMTEIRHQGLGITHYFWQTSNDERVRPKHKQRDGKRFAYAEPPDDGHPGEAVQCRCRAEPDLESVLEGL